MKTLLRIKRSIVCRLLYRLVCWINYPTSRERMWHMYACGKAQGIKEALKTLPITQVQPKPVVSEPLHLPPGMLTRQWLDEHRAAIPSQHEPTYWPEPIESFPAWLNSKPPVKPSLPDTTEAMPAVVKLLHERRQQERNAS